MNRLIMRIRNIALPRPIPSALRIFVAFVVTGTASVAALLAIAKITPLPMGAIINPSRVVSANGVVLGDLVGAGITRREVPLANVPIALQEATIAVEDASFYAHSGIDWRGIARALLANVSAGHVVQGGSTITQQLAKNLFLSGDRTLWRKIRETFYALQLELHYSKQQILSDYLNVIYYGDGATGVGMAAEYYFGKPVDTLDVAESAMLAGLPKGPSLYSPLHHLAAAKYRQHQVLAAMVRVGFLSPVAAQKAYQEPLHFVHHANPETLAPYFTAAVSRVVERQFPVTDADLYRGGLTLDTTLNPRLQQTLDRAMAQYIPHGSGLQAAAVVMDAQTGDVLAYSGGVHYRVSPYDRVQAMRQPGSTFKPFVYATAIDQGYTESSHHRSTPIAIPYDNGQRVYTVHNYDDEYTYRDIGMKEAIARSDNVYAVSTAEAVGPEAVIRKAEMYGLPHDMQPYPSLALGVFPASPLEMARAYAVFANGGYLVKPRFVTRILDGEGHTLYDTTPVRLRVESPATSYILTDLMESVMRPGGTGYRVAHMIPGTVAAKTGTTDTDAWIVGYTPRTVMAVWVGYDRAHALTPGETRLAAPIFATVMHEAFVERAQGTFEKPADVIRVAIDPTTGQRATVACPSRVSNAYVLGTEPTATCIAHPAPDATLPERAINALRSLWSWIRGR